MVTRIRLYMPSEDEAVSPDIIVGHLGDIVFDLVSPSAEDQYHYTGQEHDAVTSLQHSGYRSYDPTLGRWVTAEPLGLHRAAGQVYPYPQPE